MEAEETITCERPEDWDAWLEAHHADRAAVWIEIAKKSSGLPSITADEGTLGALCFGWIDGHRRSKDATHFVQRYSPRTKRSSWSQVNVDRAERLIEEGRMRPAGLAEIERAKADGRWDRAYASQRTATVPDDLAAALVADARAGAAFEALGRTERYAVILRLLKAATPEERARELGRALAELGGGPKD